MGGLANWETMPCNDTRKNHGFPTAWLMCRWGRELDWCRTVCHVSERHGAGKSAKCRLEWATLTRGLVGKMEENRPGLPAPCTQSLILSTAHLTQFSYLFSIYILYSIIDGQSFINEETEASTWFSWDPNPDLSASRTLARQDRRLWTESRMIKSKILKVEQL